MPPETLNLPLITREASLRLVRGEDDDMTIDVDLDHRRHGAEAAL